MGVASPLLEASARGRCASSRRSRVRPLVDNPERARGAVRRGAVVRLAEIDGGGVEAGLGGDIGCGAVEVDAQGDGRGRGAGLDGRAVAAATSAGGQGRGGEEAEGPGDSGYCAWPGSRAEGEKRRATPIKTLGLGGPATLALACCKCCRPVALRPRLSTGLPSGFVKQGQSRRRGEGVHGPPRAARELCLGARRELSMPGVWVPCMSAVS